MKDEKLEIIMDLILCYSETIGDLRKIQETIDEKITEIKEHWDNKEVK